MKRPILLVLLLLAAEMFLPGARAATAPAATPDKKQAALQTAADKVFDLSKLHTIDIVISEEGVRHLADRSDTRYRCTFTFDGLVLKDVGVRQAGGGSRGGPGQPVMPNLLATSKNSGDATVGIVSINESRTVTGTGQLSFSIAVTGANFPTGSSVRRTTVNNAVDDKDRSLTSNNARGGLASSLAFSTLMNANSRLMNAAMVAARGGVAAGGAIMSGNATLASSRRDATAIKLLEGEIEVFTPSATNGSMITIKDVLGQMGKPLDHPALVKEGIELILVNGETYGAVRDRLLNPAAVAAGVSQPDPTFANGPGVYVHDPAGKLAGFIFQDANGGTLQSGTSSTRTSPTGDIMMELRFTAGTPANAQLVVYVAVPEASKTIPFRFENVALP